MKPLLIGSFLRDGGSTSINTVKDMLAGLPEYLRKKEAFALHLGMAVKCTDICEENNLLALASVEQVCAR